MDPGPVLAVETRSGHDELVHCGHAVLLDARGGVLQRWGRPETPTFWRSTAKPVQAVAFAEVLDQLGLGHAELAVACGSHAAEQVHVDAVRRILAAIDAPETALKCAPHPPWSDYSVFTRADAQPIHNNCSGKHAGMLAVCRVRGWDLDGYLEPDHPLQLHLADVLRQASGEQVVPYGIDGCGVPTFRTPVTGVARAFQWLLGSAPGRRVLQAIAEHPVMVAGTGEFCTDLATVTKGRLIVKYGALGCLGVVDRESGRAFALRLTTGNEKASKAVTGHLLEQCGMLSAEEAERLRPHVERKVSNHAGRLVGKVEFRADVLTATAN
ncbi:MAG TPA: asparaginase [Candidatus Thermoplasmatota archaeon]|nr:asparaginase [Candidatus Thermoplasmatota archaeon]